MVVGKRTIHWMEIGLRMADQVEKLKKENVACERLAYALGAELGLKPEDVDRALNMAKSDIEDELKIKERYPGVYTGSNLEDLRAEPREVAAGKGKQYVQKVLDYREG